MVETITPVVHGGSGSRWGISLALHAIGAVVAATIVGSLLAGAGALLGAPGGVPGPVPVAAAAALLAPEATAIRFSPRASTMIAARLELNECPQTLL